MTVKQDQDRAKRLAQSVAIDLRVVLNDARRDLDEFEKYVDSWDEEIASDAHDPRFLAQRYVVERALEKIEELCHVHSGGTRMMHVRQARSRLMMLISPRDDD